MGGSGSNGLTFWLNNVRGDYFGRFLRVLRFDSRHSSKVLQTLFFGTSGSLETWRLLHTILASGSSSGAEAALLLLSDESVEGWFCPAALAGIAKSPNAAATIILNAMNVLPPGLHDVHIMAAE